MHGTLPQLPAVAHRPHARMARLKMAAIVVAVGVVAAAAIYAGYGFIDATDEGHLLLIKWGFEYPPGCG